ncbi:DUF7336 domain-containing protein [Bacillus sp. CH_203]|uniref:DUF7336 domain-containing protein n=1 Tax=Bacillus sp. CH_203 TaxID=2978216 RepID=UPI00288C6454|nr:hypothetical protein [Bacillus cereus]HDX9663237.1 hypothetical protein [Bacillus cereus]
MKVYVIMSDFGYDTNNFEGVFSTPEKAKERTDYLNKCNGGGDCFWWEEYELDEI